MKNVKTDLYVDLNGMYINVEDTDNTDSVPINDINKLLNNLQDEKSGEL